MKAPVLNFGTSCCDCGKGLFIDSDGEKFCADCTSFRPVAAEPFVATAAHETVEQADTLEELLATLAEILDDKGPDDVTIWQGQRLLMVLFGDGTVLDRRAKS